MPTSNTLSRRQWLSAMATAFSAASLSSLSTGCGRKSIKDGRQVATLWFSYGGKNREVLLDLVSKYNKAQTRYLIEPTFQGDYFEALAKIRTALAAGVAPSFTHVVGEVVPYLHEANVLEPLAQYPGADSLRLVDPLAQSGAYQQGNEKPLVAIPFNRSTPILYANKKLLDEAKLDPPSDWAQLREMARRLTARDSASTSRWGYEVPIGWWFWVAHMWQAGGEVINPDGSISLGNDAGVKAVKLWQDLIHQDKAMRPPPGRDYNAWSVTNQDFLASKAAVICTSTAFMRYLEENAKFPVMAMPLPGDIHKAVPTGGTFFVVLKSTPQPEKEAAWSFLRWMCEPEQAISWSNRTGYLPVVEGAIEQLKATGYYDSHPNDATALSQLRDARPWPWAAQLFRIQREAVEPRLEEAVLRNRDAATVLREAKLAASLP